MATMRRCGRQWACAWQLLAFFVAVVVCCMLPLSEARRDARSASNSVRQPLPLSSSLPMLRTLSSSLLLRGTLAEDTGKTPLELLQKPLQLTCDKQAEVPNVLLATLQLAPGKPRIFVRSSRDWVSNYIQEHGEWENGEVEQVVWAMKQLMQRTPGSEPVFVDVGANIGSITIPVAAHGFRVIAFEAWSLNQQMIHGSLCMNLELMRRVTLFPLGLSDARADCLLASSRLNTQNARVICGADASKPHGTFEKGDSYVGELKMDRMDAVLSGDIAVMKMDVEGFELGVLRGMRKLFEEHKVSYILMEYNKKELERAGVRPAWQVVEYLLSLGYRISIQNLRGPFLDASSAKERELMQVYVDRIALVNLYLVHPSEDIQGGVNDSFAARMEALLTTKHSSVG